MNDVNVDGKTKLIQDLVEVREDMNKLAELISGDIANIKVHPEIKWKFNNYFGEKHHWGTSLFNLNIPDNFEELLQENFSYCTIVILTNEEYNLTQEVIKLIAKEFTKGYNLEYEQLRDPDRGLTVNVDGLCEMYTEYILDCIIDNHFDSLSNRYPKIIFEYNKENTYSDYCFFYREGKVTITLNRAVGDLLHEIIFYSLLDYYINKGINEVVFDW